MSPIVERRGGGRGLSGTFPCRKYVGYLGGRGGEIVLFPPQISVDSLREVVFRIGGNRRLQESWPFRHKKKRVIYFNRFFSKIFFTHDL